MQYSLRAVNGADFDFLYRLKVACLKEYVAAIWGWNEAKQRRLFSENFDTTAGQIVVAFGRDIGQLSVEEGLNEIFLSGIYILPAYQRQGLGSQILQDLLVGARANGWPVRLQVLIGNPAQRLYQRLGFAVTGRNGTHFFMRYDWPKDHSGADSPGS